MWTTDDPRCSQCLRLSRSGWGQPVASSPGRAAPHGGRSLSPARQQLVPIVVPKSETLGWRPAAISAPSGRVAAAKAPSRSWVPATAGHVRLPAAARTQRGSWAPRGGHVRPPRCCPSSDSRQAPRAAPFHALPPSPELGAHAGVRSGRSTPPVTCAGTGHGRRARVIPPVVSWSGSLGPWANDHGHRGLTRRWPARFAALGLPQHLSTAVRLGAVLPLWFPATEARGKSGSVAGIQGVSSERASRFGEPGHDGAWSRQPR